MNRRGGWRDPSFAVHQESVITNGSGEATRACMSAKAGSVVRPTLDPHAINTIMHDYNYKGLRVGVGVRRGWKGRGAGSTNSGSEFDRVC
jgi:hypothetical protein